MRSEARKELGQMRSDVALALHSVRDHIESEAHHVIDELDGAMTNDAGLGRRAWRRFRATPTDVQLAVGVSAFGIWAFLVTVWLMI